MELIAISLARFVAFLELQSFDPRGQSTTQEAIQLFKDRYSFSKVPEKREEFNYQNGVEFLDGRMGAISIDKLVLYNNGVAIDTRSSTDDSERVMQDLLEEVKRLRGVVMLPTRRMYLSNIVFRSHMNFTCIHPAVQPLVDAVAAAVSEYLGQSVNVDMGAVVIAPDHSQTKLNPSPFSIERRVDTPFSANIYFSAAPLKTDLHISLIEKFENMLLE